MVVRSRIPLALCLLLPVVAGCQKGSPKAAVPSKPAVPAAPPVDYAALRVDETGNIPVAMYHEVAGKKNDKMFRTPESFRKDLQLLYDKGFVPVNLRDVTANRVDVPAGKSPVVLTFDDGRQSQFNLIETAENYKIDPDCALGVLEDFCKTHEGWKPKATFFVLPKSAQTQEVFGQPGLGPQKLAYLIDNGYEIGNHTTHHRSLGSANAAKIQAELGEANNSILSEAPKAEIVSFAAPYGVYPRNRKLWSFLSKGTHDGTSYNHTAVCLAAWRPMFAPGAPKYDPMRIERITPEDIRFGLKYWVDELASGRMRRYISDGDPATVSFPASSASGIKTAVLESQGVKVNAYAAGGGGSKPIVSSGENTNPGGAASQPKPIAGSTPAPKPITGN
jgi:peptidoglycan/xylan/chitin deacetylase (PgdA/CDA1 family)